MLTKDAFFKKHESTGPKVFPVDLPDGDKVWVRRISAHEKSVYEQQLNDKKKGGMTVARERLVVLCACDEDGKQLFDKDDMNRVGSLDVTILEPIFDKAYEVNGFQSKLLEAIRKNSESAQSED